MSTESLGYRDENEAVFFIPYLVNCSHASTIYLLALSFQDGFEHMPVRPSAHAYVRKHFQTKIYLRPLTN